jgi:hypothetical protein
MRPHRFATAMLAGLLFPVLTASAAWAEGPGYGGGADRLTVRWQAENVKNSKVLVLYGVGFRSGSGVTVRVGSGADQTVLADDSGVLRVPLATETVSARLSPGTSVFAAGETPAGTRWTLVGNIPPASSGRGPGDYVPWLLGGLAVVALGGGLLRPRRRRAAALAGAALAGAAGPAAATAPGTPLGAPARNRSAQARKQRRGQGSKR